MRSLDNLPHETQPDWIPPMLATLSKKRFSDPNWLYERKLDGERILAYRTGKTLRLLTRNKQNVTATYPELHDPLLQQKHTHFIVDGEVVAFSGALTSFERLQQRMGLHTAEAARASGVAVYYYLFDILHLDGRNLTQLPLRERKEILREAIHFDSPIRFCAHRSRNGEAWFQHACQHGWEGLIVKRADSPYVSRRSPDWLKFKCEASQELVIAGYTDPQGARDNFGAILVGYYDSGNLHYAGKVGTGFDHDTLAALGRRFHQLHRDKPPFAANDLPTRGVHWLQPELVANIGFTAWTRDGKLRHPRFLGLRRDKKPHEVVREEPSNV